MTRQDLSHSARMVVNDQASNAAASRLYQAYGSGPRACPLMRFALAAYSKVLAWFRMWLRASTLYMWAAPGSPAWGATERNTTVRCDAGGKAGAGRQRHHDTQTQGTKVMVGFSFVMAFLNIALFTGALFFCAITKRAITSNDGIYYAADGSIMRRSITNDGTTTFIDADGRKISTITRK